MGVHFLTQYRNPLAYPAGYAPGFDPNHPCASRAEISAVASGAGYVDLLKGKKGTIAGTILANIRGLIGPSADYNASTSNYVYFTGLHAGAMDEGTFACVFMPIPGSGYNYMFSYGVTPGFHAYRYNSSAIVLEWGFSSNVNTGLIPADNVPYFFAASYSVGNFADAYLTDLRTGKVLTFYSATAGTAITSTSGSFYIGTSEWDFQSPQNRIHSAAFMRSYTPRAAMLQWAADPWSFWYPNPGDNWIAAQAAAGGLFKITGNPRSLAGFGGGLAA